MVDVLDGGALYDKINSMRLDKGWTLYELAKKSGVSPTAIYHWRDRRSSPRLSLLEAVCSSFGISIIHFLMSDEEFLEVAEEPREVMKLWHVLSDKQRRTIVQVMESMVNPA